ncbi:TRAP transporter small permease [Clostridiisalibacter paucivorans]|uniref:TRAP transporter small permease n=1 Tax=Clostridiisalibacter paucivorans TaxID=408753 RepID=UPI00047CEA2D|nr:TRAP transporter small permease [Clostridiisalibacter paucivorans]
MDLLLFFKRLSNGMDRLVNKIVFLIIIGMIISISLQIIFRVFFDALTWTEELARYLLVWATFLGTTLAYKRGMHISVTFLVNSFPKNIRKIIVVCSILFSIIFFIVSVLFGFRYMNMQAHQVSAALRVSMRWVYLVIPIGFIIMIIHGITAILEEVFGLEEVAR